MIKVKPLPSYDRIRDVLDYDANTGIVKWKIKQGGAVPGMIAGTLAKSGYLIVKIDGIRYRIHRIIWLWMTGSEPDAFLDHRDLVRSNNRWDNLRAATTAQNQANHRISPRNTSGFKGVCWDTQKARWHAQIQFKRRTIHIGFFDTAAQAGAAYAAKAKELLGEYARMR